MSHLAGLPILYTISKKKQGRTIAGVLGVEPRLAVLETAVLSHWTIPPFVTYLNLFLLRFFVQLMRTAKFAEFLQFQFFFNCFFIARRKMSYIFTLRAFKFYKIIL